MVATAPVPSASTFAKDSLSAGSVKRPLDPTQIAPEVLTAGSNAAANPPSMGSSAFGRAMRLETITSLIGYLPVEGGNVSSPPRFRGPARASPRIQERSCRSCLTGHGGPQAPDLFSTELAFRLRVVAAHAGAKFSF